MAKRNVKQRRLRKYSIGNLRDRITIHTRSIIPPGYNSAKFTEAYDAGTPVWAEISSIDTVNSGQNVFDGVQLNDGATDLIVIRYRSGITTQNRISFEGNYYEILATKDIERRHEYWELRCKLLGDNTLGANT